MARRKESTKHPALMARPGQLVDTLNEIVDHPMWYDLGSTHMAFLAYYVESGDYKVAQEKTGLDTQWLDDEWQNNEAFGTVARWVKERPKIMADKMAEQLLGVSIVKLRDIIMEDENRTTQLAAIKHLHNVMGLGSDDKKISVQVAANSVTMFEGK
jgi:hypothetical protein